MKHVWLETGGKSHNLIFADADLDAAADKAAFGIFLNQGEVCSASSRMLLHESIADEKIARMTTPPRPSCRATRSTPRPRWAPWSMPAKPSGSRATLPRASRNAAWSRAPRR